MRFIADSAVIEQGTQGERERLGGEQLRGGQHDGREDLLAQRGVFGELLFGTVDHRNQVSLVVAEDQHAPHAEGAVGVALPPGPGSGPAVVIPAVNSDHTPFEQDSPGVRHPFDQVDYALGSGHRLAVG